MNKAFLVFGLLGLLVGGCGASGGDTDGNTAGAGAGQGGSAAGTGSSEPCIGNSTRVCMCGSAMGVQTCMADGKGYNACDCGGNGMAGTGSGAGGVSGSPQAGTDGGDPDGGVPVVGPGTVETEPVDDASYIFDQTQLRTYDIQLSAGDLKTLNDKPSAEQYVIGSLKFEGMTIGQVGVRYKGSVGAFVQPCTNATLGNEPGAKTGKCSIKLSFNEVDPEARFYGLKKLNLHSMNHDPSMMKDRLGYAMFRQFGIPASRAVHARVLINGKLEGLFIAIEQVDGRFTRSRFTEGGKGNLYKEIWPMHTDAATYENALTTNEDTMPSVQRMLDFQASIAGGRASMEKWIDRDMTIKYIAADRVMINDDGIFHWWCAEGGQGNNPGGKGNHNYYWYEAADADRLWLIPWDMDNSMETASNSFVRVNPDWDAPALCICGGLIGQLPASCDPLIHLWTEWKSDISTQQDAFIAGPFGQTNVNALLSAWETQISDAVMESSGMNGAPTVTDWQDALGDLEDGIQSMRTNHGS